VNPADLYNAADNDVESSHIEDVVVDGRGY